jgi:predicted flap endonuclease-1-like 5' DNA nuclease
MDDFTAIPGIGLVAQNRLHRAGIESFAQLADASPELLGKILGRSAQDASIQEWIAYARELAQSE